MVTTTVSSGVELEQAIAAAIAERDQGINLAETADTTGWDKKLIDQAITAFARTGELFDANDVRAVLPPDVRSALMGARFLAARNAGRIRFVGWSTSTKKNTHYKPIGLYKAGPDLNN